MPALSNVKREKLAQGVAKGLTAAKAYRQAGYRGKGHSAEAAGFQILKNVVVQARVAELQAKSARRAEITVDMIVARLEECRQIALAVDPPQTSAAVAAVLGQAKVLGLIVDRAELNVTRNKPTLLPSRTLELSEDEWRRSFDPAASKPKDGPPQN